MDHAWWASPIAYVNQGDVPLLIVHGTQDTVVPITQSVTLDSLLRVAQVPVEFRQVEDGHGGMTFVSDSVNAWVGAFLRRVLGPVFPGPTAAPRDSVFSKPAAPSPSPP
jgi:acetyl esterase/lipase